MNPNKAQEQKAANVFIDRYAKAFGRRQSFVLKAAGLNSAETSASGSYVQGADGRNWLDYGSYGLHLLGHRHEAVVAAAKTALSRMGLSTKILPNQGAVTCAEKLLETLQPKIDRVIFTNSGSEAVECAIRLASFCLLYTSPSPRDGLLSRMPSSA